MALYLICDICISYMVLNKEKRKNKKYFELLLWTMVMAFFITKTNQ